MKKDNVRYCDRCGVELTKRNNVCGFELCDKCNEVLGQQLAIMTNGEKMISAFPNGEVRKVGKGVVFSTGGWCHAYAEEWWNAECEEPTTKNDLGVDCISRKAALDITWHDPSYSDPLNVLTEVRDKIRELPSVTPQLSVPEVTALAEWIEKLTKASEDAYNKGYADGMKAQEPISDILEDIYTEIEDEYEDCVIGKLDDDEMAPCFRQITDIYGVLGIIDKYIDKYKSLKEAKDGENNN